MQKNKKLPYIITILPFGYRILFLVFMSLSILMLYAGIVSINLTLVLFGIGGLVFWSLPFCIRSNEQTVKQLKVNKENGPSIGEDLIETLRGFGLFAIIVVGALLIFFILFQVIGFIASLPVGILLTIITLILLFK